MVNTTTSISLEEKGFIGLLLPGHNPSLREGRAQTPEGKLPTVSRSANFLTQPGSTCLRIAPPTVGVALPTSIKALSRRRGRRSRGGAGRGGPGRAGVGEADEYLEGAVNNLRTELMIN